ncbi:MAG: hypothetical protein JWL83_1881 [Actinomycetia bacterium]|nr:hypothetical protein [Actinomycetes bacterium]
MPIDIGEGAPVVLLPGFALPPAMYRDTAALLARRCRVVVPELYRVHAPWRQDDIVDRLTGALAERGLDHVTLIGHSFAGGIELSYAARHPERVVELVFADTLAVSREWPLAEEAMRHPMRLLWLATPRVAAAFGRSVLTHPRQIAEAAWWGFTSGRTSETERVAGDGLRAHVLWANRDSLLSRRDGMSFARELHASFTVVRADDGKPVDHDWMYRHPQLFVEHLDQLDLEALRAS